MLPILKEAHVVDAGGAGFVMILRGMLAALRGTPVASATNVETTTTNKAEFSDFNTEDIKFSYCTEFIVRRASENEDDAKNLRAYLESIGDCVVVVDDEEIPAGMIRSQLTNEFIDESLANKRPIAVMINNIINDCSFFITRR